MEAETLILNHHQIIERIKRIAWQIYEDNYSEDEVVLIGIPNRGLVVSKLIRTELKKITKLSIISSEIKTGATGFEISTQVKNKSVILIDDVLNSGKTMMEAAAAIMDGKPKKLRTAILANRDHKRFPIGADFVGISLATTLQEHISFRFDDMNDLSVTLQ